MTREEAIANVERKINRIKQIMDEGDMGCVDMENWENWATQLEYQEMILAALRGPIPDPETGLVPCGCGKKAVFYGFDDDKGDDGLVHKTAAGCPDCPCTTDWEENQDDARKIWNKMMGYKEEE